MYSRCTAGKECFESHGWLEERTTSVSLGNVSSSLGRLMLRLYRPRIEGG